MGTRVRVLAPAKVNLHLEVYPQREDGYHPIISLFQSICWYDELEFCSLKTNHACEIVGNLSIPLEENLIYKGVNLFKRYTGYSKLGVKVKVEKSIPLGAGLGGGSSNAAATLLAMNTLLGNPLSSGELTKLGEELGSDVPFFCKASTAIVGGRGEVVFPIVGRYNYWVLVVVPSFSVSTREAYQWLDQELAYTSLQDRKETKVDSETFLMGKETVLSFSLQKPASKWDFYNAFQKVLEKRYPVYTDIRNRLEDSGACFISLSGSGSSIYGVFEEEARANKAKEILEKQFPLTKLTIPLERRPIPILE
ncbi:MAG: 4-(cytidine 5'-diphospho)-2-C-methyl-D-erythritol kinase [Spirochaetales bacterium]